MRESIFIPEDELVALNAWERRIGISNATSWRWRRKGWLKTLNIAGRQYIRRADIVNFVERAEAGDFAVANPVPPPPRSGKESAS